MLVQRVLMPVSSLESWTVLADGGPVEPIERYLAYLSDIERSPNTIKAYAHDLKDWFEFLEVRALDWREVSAGGPRRIRRLATAATDRPARWDGDAALGRAPLLGRHREQEAVGGQRALHLPRPARRRPR